jgi:hypothetical protein
MKQIRESFSFSIPKKAPSFEPKVANKRPPLPATDISEFRHRKSIEAFNFSKKGGSRVSETPPLRFSTCKPRQTSEPEKEKAQEGQVRALRSFEHGWRL